MSSHLRLFLAGVLMILGGMATAAEPLRVGVFHVDASPPIGSPLAYDPTKEVTLPLSVRGVVLLTEQRPIVLCAVDWIGISNDAYHEFRRQLAQAAETDPARIAVHVLHQHDAPQADLSAAAMLAELGIVEQVYDVPFLKEVIQRTSKAVAQAVKDARPATHLGLGEGIVEKVASNRRILGDDGKVKHVRFTATKDPVIRDAPVGTIDPKLKLISFWNGEDPIVAITYYATHPQSYYRTGQANPDFPGMARNDREAETKVPHVHFNGAGGNIGAGKWNDGSPENRPVLAARVAAGMKAAWDSTQRTPISASDVAWKSIPVSLPLAPHLDAANLKAILADKQATVGARAAAASNLAWVNRCQSGDTIDISCLRLGSARVLHLPGELFVEYQLAAQQLRPDLFVAMAAYGDDAPGYIGTEIAYSEGGYETSQPASRVAPAVEGVLMDAIQKLLQDD
ncbi:MAG: hypothetical protein U0872_06125 [Planctomycetaceae bacterium]